jgi:hypothetical protein
MVEEYAKLVKTPLPGGISLENPSPSSSSNENPMTSAFAPV